MTSCWACEASLDPAWKFCIRCGVSVAAHSTAETQKQREPVNAYSLFGWIVAGLGAVLLIAGIVLFLVYD